MAGVNIVHRRNDTPVGYLRQNTWRVSEIDCALRSPAKSYWLGADESCDSRGGLRQLHVSLVSPLGECLAYATVEVVIEQV